MDPFLLIIALLAILFGYNRYCLYTINKNYKQYRGHPRHFINRYFLVGPIEEIGAPVTLDNCTSKVIIKVVDYKFGGLYDLSILNSTVLSEVVFSEAHGSRTEEGVIRYADLYLDMHTHYLQRLIDEKLFLELTEDEVLLLQVK